MRSFLQFAAALALLSVAVGAAVLSWDAHRLAEQTGQTIETINFTIETQNTNLVADETKLRSTLDLVDAAAAEQRAYWLKTSADSDKTVKAMRLMVDRAGLLLSHTDEQLNGRVLPDLTLQFDAISQDAQMTLGTLGHAGDALTSQINDLGPTVANLGETSSRLAIAAGSGAEAVAHADHILADGEKTADYYEKKLTTPASFAHRVAMTLLDVGSKLGSIMAGFVK